MPRPTPSASTTDAVNQAETAEFRRRRHPNMASIPCTEEDEAILDALPWNTQVLYSLADTMDTYWINVKIDDSEPNYHKRHVARAGRGLPTREYMNLFFEARDKG